ncbi:ABC transporter permease [Cohnella lubricantis]|uniref:ABC transporter permease n=1 Tax=Cohnella lubricantis TaxID=2163172 RepID=A0A841T5Q3_9BACL|nr:ABC transporter permease [Cohnella lubricantis]MBB6676863.1 ABC transporter permease [Cohnella lubricantis]MBP2119443.1 ABC-2 type transport system permease protein [Cohnella lubricantis]
MTNFWNLVQNENMKIYLRLRTWIMLGIIVLIPILLTVGLTLVTDDSDGNMWELMGTETIIVFSLITIFTVVISAESVAGEFSAGTIKLLLIRPWSRSSILASKYVALLLFSILQSIVCFAVTWAINALVLGYTSDPGGIIPESSPMEGHSIWAYMGVHYLYEWLQLVMVVSFAFMLSSAFRSSGLAIGLSIFLLFAGGTITGLLTLTDKAWVKYILFANLDLTSYLDGRSPLPNMDMTLGFSLIMLAVYFIIFNAVSWTVFRKRDVAA